MLPALMFVLALMLEPACLLYTTCVMRSAAAEGLRATQTGMDGPGEEACVDYVRRRLAAIPEVAPFHVGGEGDWEVSVSGGGTSTTARVEIAGHARPLPLFAAVTEAFAETDDTGIVLKVEVEQEVRPDWFGGSYDTWTGVWG